MKVVPYLGVLPIALGLVAWDVAIFVIFFFCATFGFSLAFLAFTPVGSSSLDNDWSRVLAVPLWSLFNEFEPSYDLFDMPHSQGTRTLFTTSRFLSFTLLWAAALVSSVILVNLLIAMMTNSYSKIRHRDIEEYRFARIETIHEYQSLPRIPPPLNVFFGFIKYISGSSSAKGKWGMMKRKGSLLEAVTVFGELLHKNRKYQSLEDLQLQPYDAEKAATLERGMLLEYLKEDGQRKRKIEQSEVQIQQVDKTVKDLAFGLASIEERCASMDAALSAILRRLDVSGEPSDRQSTTQRALMTLDQRFSHVSSLSNRRTSNYVVEDIDDNVV